jgi:hypothetical protein
MYLLKYTIVIIYYVLNNINKLPHMDFKNNYEYL